METRAPHLSALVEEFLKRYGGALAAGETNAIAACWEVPALVVADDAVIRVDTVDKTREFLRQSHQHVSSDGHDVDACSIV